MSQPEKLPAHVAFALEVPAYILQPLLELALVGVRDAEGLTGWAVDQAKAGLMAISQATEDEPDEASELLVKIAECQAAVTAASTGEDAQALAEEVGEPVQTISAPLDGGASYVEQGNDRIAAWERLRERLLDLDAYTEAIDVCGAYAALVENLPPPPAFCRPVWLLGACWVLPGSQVVGAYPPFAEGLGEKMLARLEEHMKTAADKAIQKRRMESAATALQALAEATFGGGELPIRARKYLALLNTVAFQVFEPEASDASAAAKPESGATSETPDGSRPPRFCPPMPESGRSGLLKDLAAYIGCHPRTLNGWRDHSTVKNRYLEFAEPVPSSRARRGFEVDFCRAIRALREAGFLGVPSDGRE